MHARIRGLTKVLSKEVYRATYNVVGEIEQLPQGASSFG